MPVNTYEYDPTDLVEVSDLNNSWLSSREEMIEDITGMEMFVLAHGGIIIMFCALFILIPVNSFIAVFAFAVLMFVGLWMFKVNKKLKKRQWMQDAVIVEKVHSWLENRYGVEVPRQEVAESLNSIMVGEEAEPSPLKDGYELNTVQRFGRRYISYRNAFNEHQIV